MPEPGAMLSVRDVVVVRLLLKSLSQVAPNPCYFRHHDTAAPAASWSWSPRLAYRRMGHVEEGTRRGVERAMAACVYQA